MKPGVREVEQADRRFSDDARGARRSVEQSDFAEKLARSQGGDRPWRESRLSELDRDLPAQDQEQACTSVVLFEWNW